MPKEAVKLGAVDQILPLDRIPDAMMAYTTLAMRTL
jgi:chemotaxis response regulator CheB